MSDRYTETRARARDSQFKENILELLERIAIALENPLREVLAEPYVAPQPLREVPMTRGGEYIHRKEAAICQCGDHLEVTCNQCTPARLAWVYNQREESL